MYFLLIKLIPLFYDMYNDYSQLYIYIILKNPKFKKYFHAMLVQSDLKRNVGLSMGTILLFTTN